ncbi:hypothetical protein Goe24_02420 [Bacillus phage vB_BsuM-Goe24]|uniref:Uncharacterized protein n=1 Tax=Bacillus phage vB_BsuM-Goe3 TaxID=1933063 RepID=A0A217ERF8_BPGO3|nr:hypothetical protein HWB07_gp073 [Bacillus phage vB_BsuM-Goe3]APZ82697.1 hypothetical protein Goe3_c23600 [Bacillus phage vB_BsuM-Goe3]QDP43265.1 hypothetical protein Goe7_c02400 [Bacillus phage vB_BveM-Goe7]WCS69617.1 hypothetical protein Goe24_02420 [Bacillus phage vB_BsuM-Goe24]
MTKALTPEEQAQAYNELVQLIDYLSQLPSIHFSHYQLEAIRGVERQINKLEHILRPEHYTRRQSFSVNIKHNPNPNRQKSSWMDAIVLAFAEDERKKQMKKQRKVLKRYQRVQKLKNLFRGN